MRLTKVNPIQPLEVNPERADKAEQVLVKNWGLLTDEQRLMVFAELNLYDLVSYNAEGELVCTGTELQIVALAAAFAAVVEAGGYVKI